MKARPLRNAMCSLLWLLSLLRIVLGGMVHVAFVRNVGGVHRDDPAPHPAGLRVPAHVSRLRVEINVTSAGAAKLKAEKGINLPESQLSLPALSAKDVEDLPFVVKHADMVALSFVQRPQDIEALLREMQKLKASQLGIVLKIETQAGFNGLPLLLLAAMRHPRVAVMVARGDLGVEVGFERLSEVQEEILWLCEAAHVPVIWATQVLESLAKGGMPSRAEVTDAAMGKPSRVCDAKQRTVHLGDVGLPRRRAEPHEGAPRRSKAHAPLPWSRRRVPRRPSVQ